MSRLVFCAYLTLIISIIVQAASSIDKCPSVTDFPSSDLRSFSEEDFAWQDQKSLVIVFDMTSSMRVDIEQLRAAAIEIVNELSEREDNVIENYILSLFDDPYIAEPFVTTDPSELIARLNEVILGTYEEQLSASIPFIADFYHFRNRDFSDIFPMTLIGALKIAERNHTTASDDLTVSLYKIAAVRLYL
ncbi:CLUMA_CG010742, isoform A [Clunio marinus]|uniref:CLUMA_CG010742, isoform A n=1 Tax=Clunio marinus TaxID=568069 RepID=A0A1J1IAP2_9DIPT|nr:CLUMA_CG010742, isoform A [Clunio marinus]